MPDPSDVALDPQLVAKLLAASQPGVVPKQPLPDNFSSPGDPNPLIRALLDHKPYTDPRTMENPPEGAAIAPPSTETTYPPKIAREALVGAARPILDAGQYLGGVMAGNVEPTGSDAAMHALNVGSQFLGPTTKGATFIGALGAKRLKDISKFDALPELESAKMMALHGANRNEVWSKTGWFRGVDGKWKFEIPDNPLGVQEGGGVGIHDPGGSIYHPVMAGLYPELNHPTSGLSHIVSINNHGKVEGGYWQPSKDYPGGHLEVDAPKDKARETIGHELQHLIQRKEGFGLGGAPEKMEPFAQMLIKGSRDAPEGWMDPNFKTGSVNELARDLYYRLTGEVESRNIQHRLDFTPEQRYTQHPPWTTMDVPEHKQIVRFLLGGKDASAPIKTSQSILDRADTFHKELWGLSGKHAPAMRQEFDAMIRKAMSSNDWTEVVAHMDKMKK